MQYGMSHNPVAILWAWSHCLFLFSFVTSHSLPMHSSTFPSTGYCKDSPLTVLSESEALQAMILSMYSSVGTVLQTETAHHIVQRNAMTSSHNQLNIPVRFFLITHTGAIVLCFSVISLTVKLLLTRVKYFRLKFYYNL